MRKLLAAALFLGLLVGPVYAQEPEKVRAFNDAWGVYAEAAKSGDVGATITAAEDVLAKGRAIFPAADERIAMLLQNYGSALRAGGMLSEARVQLEDALGRLERIHGKNSIKILPALVEFADANAELYRPQDQIRVYKRALKIVEDVFGDDSPQYAELSYRMGRNVYEKSRSPFGEKYVRTACKLFEKHHGVRDRRVGMCELTLGQTKMSDGFFAQSLPHFESALASFSGDTDLDRSYRVKARSLIVHALEETGKSDEATAYLLDIGRDLADVTEAVYMPVYRPAPEYTDAIITKRLRGYVVVELDVDAQGYVHNAVVVDSGPPENDENARPKSEYRPLEAQALRSVMQYRFAPHVQDDGPVGAKGVRTTVLF